MSLSGISAPANTGLSSPFPSTASASRGNAAPVATNGRATDSVDLSPLALALKGDALKLFSTMSADDRTTLGGFVQSGAMSAVELNDALNDRLKQARGKAFWDAASQKDAAHPDRRENADLQKQHDTLASALDKKLGSMKGAVLLKDLQAIDKEIDPIRQTMSALSQNMGSADLSSSRMLSGEFAVKKLYRSDSEKSAGQRLGGLGFSSSSFDDAVRSMAQDDVSALGRS